MYKSDGCLHEQLRHEPCHHLLLRNRLLNTRGSDGYTKNPDGIILQWGSVPLYSTRVSKTKTGYFPMTFPSSCYSVSVTAYGPNSTSGDKDDWYLHVTSFSRSSVTVVVASPSSDKFVDTSNAYFYYLAIGM
ncbi:gp53-like domain-containing protein [Negativicoccus succinicivorans]|uniref:gp53-like domain-containing protein n=1 Tax=Negativicoccus succinicivorans TaxID=620903 RepID=UPI003B5A3BD0